MIDSALVGKMFVAKDQLLTMEKKISEHLMIICY